MPARFANHPIHPMLIPLPIGLWVFSLVCDVVTWFFGGAPFWDRMAFYTMAGGIAGALLAAVPGFVDFLSLHNPTTKRIGLWHMVVNLSVVGLYTVNLWLRTTSPPRAIVPFALSLAGVALLGLSGWLGGELVFRHGVAVERERPMIGR